MFLAWWLLRIYPKEGIRQKYYTWGIAVLSAAVGSAVSIMEVLKADIATVLYIFDVTSCAVVAVLMGYELMRLERKRSLPGLSQITFGFYAFWAVLQLGYLFKYIPTLKPILDIVFPHYGIALILFGFGSLLFTALLTSLVLQDRPEFKE